MTDTKYHDVPTDTKDNEETVVGLIQKESIPLRKRDKPWKKYLMAVWAAVECMLLGGLVYGWHSLLFVLKKEGIYADLCPPANVSLYTLPEGNGTESETLIQAACPAQDDKLNLAFTLGTTLMTFSSPFMGHLQFTFGTRIARIVLLCFLLCGTLVIAFLDTSTPYLIFIGLTCIAIGGLPVLVTNIQVANLFVVGGSTVVGILSGSFDVSATVQLFVKIGFENGISRRYSYLFISSLQVMILISTFLWLPKTVFQKCESTGKTLEKEITEDTELEDKSAGNDQQDSDEKQLRTVQPRLLDCVLSKVFLSHVGWLSILQLRFYFFIGSMNAWLFNLTNGQNELVSHYTNASLFIQLGGILTSLLSGFIFDLERRRNKGKRTVTEQRLQPSVIPQTVTSFLAILLSTMVLIPSMEVLYVDFIILTFFRSFMYGIGAAYIQMVFPGEYFGFLYGVMIVIGGIIGFLQYPLFMWMEAPPKNPDQVNIFLLVLMLVSLLHPLHIWWTCRKANKKAVKSKDLQEESEYVFISKRPWCR